MWPSLALKTEAFFGQQHAEERLQHVATAFATVDLDPRDDLDARLLERFRKPFDDLAG